MLSFFTGHPIPVARMTCSQLVNGANRMGGQGGWPGYRSAALLHWSLQSFTGDSHTSNTGNSVYVNSSMELS